MLPALLEALGSAGVGVVAFAYENGKTEKLYLNECLAKSLGYTPEAWRETPLWQLIAPSKRQQINQLYERLINTDNTMPPVLEVTLSHRDGHEFRAEVATSRIETDGKT